MPYVRSRDTRRMRALIGHREYSDVETINSHMDSSVICIFMNKTNVQ